MLRTWIACLLVACASPEALDGGLDVGDASVTDAQIVIDRPRGTLLVPTMASNGTLELRDDAGYLLVRDARAEILLDDDSVHATTGCTAEWTAGALDARLSALEASDVRERACEADGVALTWRVGRRGEDAIVLTLDVANTSASAITVLRASPLTVEDGAFLGARLERHRSLDGGADVVRDSEVHLRTLTDRRPATAELIPIPMRGALIANHTHAIADLSDGFSIVAGFLESERAFPVIGVDARRITARDPATNRPGFSLYADALMLFDGKRVAPGETLEVEALFLSAAPTVHDGLEALGETIALRHGITAGEHGNPTMWNSWSGGSGSGGLGQDIDEAIVRASLEAAVRDLVPFGFDTFPIDDGYQRADGDWEVDPAAWPSGMDGVFDDIGAAGMAPGLWAKLFVVEDDAPIALASPSLLADPADARVAILSPGDGRHVLDLSNDEAVAWAAQQVTRFREDWGLRFFKLDFAYLAFPYGGGARPELTSVERYVRAVRAVREAAGDDVHVIGIGLVGLHYGITDAIRTTYDNGPTWAEDDPFALLAQAGTFQGSVRTASRRWWLGGRVFVSHDDALHFRGAIGDDEARTLASFMALEGSTIDVGEDLTTLSDDDIETLRRVMPARPDGIAARPLDLMIREYPELYELDGDGPATRVVGLLHWGRNFDRSVEPPVEMAEAPRTLSVAATGFAYERWSHTFLGAVDGTLERTLMPRTGEVIAVVPDDGRPYVLGGRHVVSDRAGGVTTTRTDDTYVVTIDVPAMPVGARPFDHVVDLLVPDGWALDATTTDVATFEGGRVVRWAQTSAAGTSGAEVVLTLTRD